VDNVDLPAATDLGVLVMNTPGATPCLSLNTRWPYAPWRARSPAIITKWQVEKKFSAMNSGANARRRRAGSIGREVVAGARLRDEGGASAVRQPARRRDLHVELDFDRLLAASDYISLHVALLPRRTHALEGFRR
jgi:lactate dehydrogenase-like 2-hydroxyacid dehydrogenase